MAKVLVAPDLHYGYDNYSVPGPDGVPSRLAEWRSCAGALVDLVKQLAVDVVLMPGDAFTSGKHSVQAFSEVYRLYRRLEAAGAVVVGTFGNHDFDGSGKEGPVEALARIGQERWGITRPQLVDLAVQEDVNINLQVAVLPWVKATALLEQSAGTGDLNMRASAALVSIVHGLAAQVRTNGPAILLGHWPVAGCTMSSGQILHGGEPALPLGDLQAGPWSAVVMGHIHKRQQFPGQPFTCHVGALTRRDFGEEHDPCGCYVFNTDTCEATWYDLPARRFYTWDLAAGEIQALTNGERFAMYDRTAFAQDAIVRVRYRATDEQNRQIDQDRIRQAVLEAGAHHLAGVFPEIIRSERTRAEVTEETSPLDALGQWLNLKHDLSTELKAEVAAAADQLMREVK